MQVNGALHSIEKSHVIISNSVLNGEMAQPSDWCDMFCRSVLGGSVVPRMHQKTWSKFNINPWQRAIRVDLDHG